MFNSVSIQVLLERAHYIGAVGGFLNDNPAAMNAPLIAP
jgi:hypothetical protein